MSRRSTLRAAVGVLALLVSGNAFATAYTSFQTGDWNQATTWSPSGVPTIGDTVTITSNHTVTVSDARIVQTVTFDTTPGNKVLAIAAAGSLLVEQALPPAVTLTAPSPGSTSILRIDGGTLDLSNAGISITGGASSASKLEFTSFGGTATIAGDVAFSGTAANAIVDFGPLGGLLEIGKNLTTGGTIINNTNSGVRLNGTGAQTIAGYTFNNLEVSKAGGTATLAQPITVNGNLDISLGLFDDGGQQISLNSGGTSSVSVGAGGVLKLGSAASATTFPSPAASVTLAANSAVSYHAGVPQTIATGFTYGRLFVQSVGGAVAHSFSGTLQVANELDVFDNGANVVTLDIDGQVLDVDGNLVGDGTISVGVGGSINVGGNFNAPLALDAASGSTVTYDGAGAQSVLGATYADLTINKSGGVATMNAAAIVDEDLTITTGSFSTGSVALSVAGTFTNNGAFSIGGGSASFAGDVVNNGLFNGGTGSSAVILDGGLAQSWSGSQIANVNDLTVNNSGSGVTFTQSVNVIDLLISGNGNAIVNTAVINVLSGGSATSTNGWVVGNLSMGLTSAGVQRTFIVGTNTGYSPVDVTPANPGTLMVNAIDGPAPNTTGANVIQRYWILSNNAGITSADLVFHYLPTDVTLGDETQFLLARYDTGWTRYGLVDDVNDHGFATAVSALVGTWTTGQKGSLGAAGKLAVLSVNGGSSPYANTPFDVDVQSQHDNGNPANVATDTTVDILLAAGSGSLLGSSETILNGTSSATVSGVTYDTVEATVQLEAQSVSGESLASGTSTVFSVVAPPSTITVTSINDSGPGTLREAIETHNAGGCTQPCTIDFSTSGEIVLLSALPPITQTDLTIDGFTAPGASANTNAFGLPSNAALTVALDGSNGIGIGFDIQETFVKIRGFAIKNFTNGGLGVAVKFTGDNSGSNVSGCYIGTDLTGLLAAGNAHGVVFEASFESSVGGSLPADRNVISHSSEYAIAVGDSVGGFEARRRGIGVEGTFGTGSNTIGISGNYIGTKADLSAPMPNDTGVTVCALCSSVSIADNVIGGSTLAAVEVHGNGVGLTGNRIGIAGDFATMLPNGGGIELAGNNATVGGPSPSDRNYIAGTTGGAAIYITGDNNTVDHNVLGFATDGTTVLPNSVTGISIGPGGADNSIGATFGNTIANSGADGIMVNAAAGLGNVFRFNSIYANAHHAIDIDDDGVTPNDPADGDTGANNRQNFPTLASAEKNGGSIDVKLSLDSSGGVNTNFFLFELMKGHPTLPSEAKVPLGISPCMAGNVFTNVVISIPTVAATVGDRVVATATAYSDAACTTPSEGTSELSAPVTINGDIHWNNAAGGAWENAANWNPMVVPTAGDDAYVDLAGNYIVTVSSPAAANAVHVGAGGGTQNLHVTGGGSLTVTSPSTVVPGGDLTLDGNFGGSGSLTVTGILNWKGGTVSGIAALNIDPSGTLNFTGAAPRTLTQRLLTIGNGATAYWTDGMIQLQTGAGIDNYGTFEVQSDSFLMDLGSDAGFDNFGTFRKSTTAGTTTFQGVDFTHTGAALDLQTGSFNPSNATIDAAATIGSGAELHVDADTVTLGNSAAFTGAGKVRVSGGVLNVNGTTVPMTHLDFQGGVVNGSGTLTTGPSGMFLWTGGTMGGTGTTKVASGGTLTISGPLPKGLDQRTLLVESSGTVNFGGTGFFSFQNGGNVSNSGLFDTIADTTIMNSGGAGAFTNTSTGTFKKSAGTGTSMMNVTLDANNGGTVRIQTGTLNPATFNNNGTLWIDGTLMVDDAVTTLGAGSSVTGTGLVHVNGGTFTVNAPVTVADIQLDAGFVSGSGALTATNFDWTGGTHDGSGSTTIATSATISGPTPKNLTTRSFTNGASATTTLSALMLSLQSGASITNNGLFVNTADSSIMNGGAAGNFTNASGATFRKQGSTGITNFNSIGFDNNGGTVDLQTGTLDVAGGTNNGTLTLAVSTTFLVNSDNYTFGPSTSVGGPGNVSVTAGTLTIGGAISLPNFLQSGGTVDGSSTLTLSGVADWSGGTMSGAGTTQVSNLGTLTLSNATPKTLDNRTLSNAGGNVNWTGFGTLQLQNGGNIANAGTFTVTSDGMIMNGPAAGSFVNTGTFRKQTATGSTTISVPFSNNLGTLDAQTGILSFNTFTQTAGSLAKIRLGGVVPGTQHAQLQFPTGNPTLAGTLEITLAPAYEPLAGDNFRILQITGGGHIGDFTQPYTYPALTGGKTFSDAYDANGLVVSVAGIGDLSIGKTAPSNVVVGSPISYTLTVSNAGPDAATAVSVTDTLPAGHTGITAFGTGWTCNVVGSTVTCTAASLPAGTAPSITINATAPNTPQSFTNVANVSSSNDPTPGNNSGSANVTVDPQSADLSLTAFSPAGVTPPSTPFLFNFHIQNNGPQTATGVVFTAPIPAEVTFNSAAGCTFAANTVTCNIPSILSGNTHTVTMNMTSGTTAGTHSVTGSATAIETDPDTSDNSITASVLVGGSNFVVTNTNDSGSGSLRQALTDASGPACSAPCTVSFNIGAGPYLIQPQSDLPPVANDITVDGTTQPGYSGVPVVQVDMGFNPGSTTVLYVPGNNSRVKGLSLTGSNGMGLLVNGTGNLIEGNYIGLDPLGVAAPNGHGIIINGNNNTIGGTTAAQRNVISGNTGDGVRTEDDATGNTIAGNYIGTDPAGTAARPNDIGIELLDETHQTTIGGATAAHRNVISGNTTYGIRIEGDSGSVIGRGVATELAGKVTDTAIHNNWIGPDATGAAAIGGASAAGLAVDFNASATDIQDNVISGHAAGVVLTDSTVSGTAIAGNFIGVGPDGSTPMPNANGGIINTASTDAQIASGNVIANNGTSGIIVLGGSGIDIGGNSIYGHPTLGIDLSGDGSTANDATDSDTGANGLQNFPLPASASLIGGGNLTVNYSIDSSGSTANSLAVEFFRADPSGEGQVFLHRTCIASNTFAGGTTFSAPSIVAGEPIVLTATGHTDASCTSIGDGTSEFSPVVLATTCTPPAATVNAPSAVCANSTGNVATVTAPTATSFNWSLTNGTITGGQGTSSITFTAGPTGSVLFSVTVADNLGCPNTAGSSSTINPNPVVNISGPATACGSATLDAGAFASYLWSTGATTQTINVTTTGTYSVTVTDASGCTGFDSHTITVNPNPTATITPSGPTTFCAGSSVTLTATAASSYLWSNGATTQSIVVTANGTFSVTITDANGCSALSPSVNVTVLPAPVVNISGPNSSCGPATLDAGVFSSYLWSTGATTQTINVTTTGTYSVAVTDANGCTGNDSHNIVINPAGAANITGPTAMCPGDTVTLDAGIGFASYLWSTGETTQSIDVSPGSTTTYSVNVTDGNGCNGSDTHTVTVHPAPTATIAPSGPTTFCTGGSVTLTANAGTSYLWSNGATTQSIVVTAGGTFSVAVTNASGCTATSASVPVTVNPNPNVNITGATSTCASTPVTLDAGVFASYLWSNGATTQTITVSPATTTTYSVTVSDGTCSGSDSHTVTVTANPTATITAPATLCSNASSSASVGTQPGATYAWSITNGTFTSPNNGPNVTFIAGASGSLALSVTVTSGACTSNGSTTIPISAPPVVTITGPTQVCPNAAFTLSAPAGFASYLWSTGATTPSINAALPSGSQAYTVTVTNASGCSATDTHTVNVTTVSANINAPSSANAGATGLNASVPAQPGTTYTWSIVNGTITSGQGTSSITFNAGTSGTTQLSITVTLGGCTANDVHNVSINGSGPAEADLRLGKSAASSVQAGGTLVYTLNLTNFGPSDASGVRINDPLPAGTTLVSISDGAFSCAPFNGVVVCNGFLAAGNSRTIAITVNAPSTAGTITNTATVTSSTDDPQPNDNTASATTVVNAAPVNCTSTPPSLLLPVAGAQVNSPVTFTWSAVTGAIDYELWIINSDTTFLAGTTNTTSMTIPLGTGEAGWYVVARLGGDCGTLASSERRFEVLAASNCSTHIAPQLTAPAANSTLTSPVTFSWMPVPEAIGYRVWVSAEGTAAQDVGTTNGAITLTADVPPGAISAHVEALFSGCPETSSPNVSFNVARPDGCAGRTSASLLAPANNAVVNTSLVDFSWTASNTDAYRLWLSIDGAAPEVAGTTSETSMRVTIPFGSVEWWIQNLYDGCAAVDSPHARFTVPHNANCSTAAPELLSPANNTTVTSGEITFLWTAVANAVSYEVWLSSGGTTPTLLGTTTATSLNRIVGPGALQWFVRAMIDRCPPRDSQTARFTFAPEASCRANQAPHAVSPLPGARVTSPVDFSWTAPAGATSYDLYLLRGNNAPLIRSTTTNFLSDVAVPNGNARWFVRAYFANCSPLDSTEQRIVVVPAAQACADLDPPVIAVPGQLSSGVPFLLQWNQIPGATSYQLQTSDNATFANAQLVTTGDTSRTLTRTNNGSAPLALFARVRALDTRCSPHTVTPFGPTAAIFILPSSGTNAAAPLTGNTMTMSLPLGAELAGQSFVVTVKEPWLTVTPQSGIVPPGGTTLNIFINVEALPLGTSLGALHIALTSSARGAATNATTFKIPTMNVSKVTPVTPTPKSTPPPDALIIPAVAHAGGINSLFQSDVRVTNSSALPLQYQLTFTPTGTGGLEQGRQTTFAIEPGHTMALDDVLQGWFGTGGHSVTGTLEIRPLTQTEPSTSSSPLSGLADLVTFASSRTFNLTANGTFGQYIPAVPFANFVGAGSALVPPTVLSLQQIAQSDRYRTNLGIVEGSGDAASLLVKVFGSNGQMLKEFPVELAGGQHTQLNSFLSTQGVGPLSDGRVEISVIGGLGKVTAYASVLDNATSDPLLVTPVALSDAGNTKWVVPGVADLNNGVANWQTDMRLFNAGTTDVDASLLFYSQSGGAPKTASITIPAGQVRQFDRALSSVFGSGGDGGAIHISTATPARLVATARTYNQTSTGTYGQFISGVTPNESTGVGARPLQILQVEESDRFRSNIGLAETTGKPVTLELAITPPDAKVTIFTEVPLGANEFRQLNSVLRSVGLSETYNARVSVRAIAGEGRVTAYASVIDMLTNDPTYVPAQ
jgi:uncharacterized repeat protein (TIGR01451 family)